jgi:DNA transformation protein
MTVSNDYIAYVLDQLNGLGTLRVKRMFGGAGIYCDELFFAILVDDELYFKVDEHNRNDYERLSLKPFTFLMKKDRKATMSYYPVPVDVLEDSDRLAEWAGKALEAAQRVKRNSH